MELDKWFYRQASLKLLKEGKLITLLKNLMAGYYGYAIQGDGRIVINVRGEKRDVILQADKLKYNLRELEQFHNIGFVTNHPSSKKKVRRLVYITEVSNGYETLLVETTNERVQETLIHQYKAIDHIDGQIYKYKNASVDLSGSFQSLNYTYEKRVYKNIIRYSNTEDVVRVIDGPFT